MRSLAGDDILSVIFNNPLLTVAALGLCKSRLTTRVVETPDATHRVRCCRRACHRAVIRGSALAPSCSDVSSATRRYWRPTASSPRQVGASATSATLPKFRGLAHRVYRTCTTPFGIVASVWMLT
ncbi:hypothetical protein BR93DRAFT_377929 [Coniochaeta sp. PMI_546]|nr:hypothetical protein BR93DRAFT_377929 [Coniochaeta sp. PMI_546]